eukprot:20812-Eustigmatos_ZCMA.PRE.1
MVCHSVQVLPTQAISCLRSCLYTADGAGSPMPASAVVAFPCYYSMPSCRCVLCLTLQYGIIDSKARCPSYKGSRGRVVGPSGLVPRGTACGGWCALV